MIRKSTASFFESQKQHLNRTQFEGAPFFESREELQKQIVRNMSFDAKIVEFNTNKPRTAQVGAISKAQK